MKRIVLIAALFCSVLLFGQNNYQFLGTYDNLGVPDYLEENDIVSQATLDLVSNSLPEGYPVPVYNPHYITAGYDTDLMLLENAEVYVTFVKEGAGYKNVLGFYTYDLTNPQVTTPQPQDITIVFPNVSEGGSGGGLSAGNKVRIGSFPAGTGIGWVLLANGWNNIEVTPGQWQLFSNPLFNPETDPTLQHHNVLLADPENERILLGFEDIRRDYASCDNDFNDAVFYITSTPYTAMRIGNIADVDSAADVSSGNDGGLESNGDLANLIAKRNFKRVQNNLFLNKKQSQSPFANNNFAYRSANNQLSIEALFPDTGMFGTEVPYVSSPEDLLGITNADEVFSVDYYSGDNRVAAALATKTTGNVYDHSKVICDRLNGSSLEDVRTIQLQGHEIIMVKLKRANGVMEYALSFSVEQTETENILHSYWNIGQYPEANYLNLQVWGASMGQVCSIVNHALAQLDGENTLVSNTIANRIPSVFVKNGTYKNGMLNLEIVNKSMATTLNFEGNKKATELSEMENFTQQIPLSLDYTQSVAVEVGGIFDIGFSVNANTSERPDGLYLADGPWGIDYNAQETVINNFEVAEYMPEATGNGVYAIERNPSVSGELFGTMNLFRNILAGELLLDASEYEAVNFTVNNTHNVEVVLITEGLTDWNKRLRFQIPVNASNEEFSIPFSSFTNPDGDNYNNEKVKGLVFSVMGSYSSFEPFSINVSSVTFGAIALSNETFTTQLGSKMYNYPNPFNGNTTVVLPVTSAKVSLQMIDMTGRTLLNKEYTPDASNSISVQAAGLPKGIYIINVKTEEGKTYNTRCVVE